VLQKVNKYTFLIFAISLFVVAAIIENGLLKKHPEIHLVEDFREQLWGYEEKLTECTDKIASAMAEGDMESGFYNYITANSKMLRENGFGFLV
jgi:hypothetical protein